MRINDGTKGQKQASIDPKLERREIRPNSSIKQSLNKFKTASYTQHLNDNKMDDRKHIVIVGGGFAGLRLVKE